MFLQGRLLIASAHLLDPNFAQSVVLVVEHSAEGAFGVVLNRPTPETVGSLWTNMRGLASTSNAPVHAGGPVPGPLVALHAHAPLGDVEVVPGLWATLPAERIDRLVECDPTPLRVYAGYSGWGAGQLETELQRGAWLLADATALDPFHTESLAFWQEAIRRAHGEAFPHLPPPPPSGRLN